MEYGVGRGAAWELEVTVQLWADPVGAHPSLTAHKLATHCSVPHHLSNG